MDYPQKQSEEAEPQIEEKPWWERKPDPEASREKLMEQIKAMQRAQKNIPRGLVVKQFVALVYMVVNIAFMYASIGSRSVGYIAAYMVPLIIVLVDYFMVVGRLKRMAAGEET